MSAVRVRVEQAIASGHTLDWIIDRLGVSPRFVDAVLVRMDAAAAKADHAAELCAHRSHPGGAE